VSILLESLNQQVEGSTKRELPNIHSSHFDDEMLGDEGLYKQLKLWKMTALLLLFLIVVSWTYFLTQTISQPSKVVGSPKMEKKWVKNKKITDLSQQAVETSIENKAGVDGPKVEAEIDTKGLYKPQKRKVEKEPSATFLKNRNQVQSSNEIPKGPPIEIAELPEELKSNFPQIEVNSYVIANKEEDSFVILGGLFYKNNQVITPNLTLRKITSEHMVVEFHSYLVKIPLK
jgi:hypothetical protein